MLTHEDQQMLRYHDRMIQAYRNFNQTEIWSMEAWRAAGEKFTTWPYWAKLIGPRPVEKKQNGAVEMEWRKRA